MTSFAGVILSRPNLEHIGRSLRPPFGVLPGMAQGMSPMIDRPGTGERVYHAIKTHLLSEGAQRPRERVPDLSRRFGPAPPRCGGLHHLVGERLLAALPGKGFLVPRMARPSRARRPRVRGWRPWPLGPDGEWT